MATLRREGLGGWFAMEKVFIYWDNSNIFISAQEVAIEREGMAARHRVRVHFRNLLELAHAGREIEHAIAVGSIPPELRHVWNRAENEGVTVLLLERGAMQGREQGVDQELQTAMLRDAFDYNGNPGIAVMLTGRRERLRTMAWAFTPIWSACTTGDGGSRCCRGGIAATAECGNGRSRTASSLRWMTSTTASPFWDRRFLGQPIANPRDPVPVDLDRRP